MNIIRCKSNIRERWREVQKDRYKYPVLESKLKVSKIPNILTFKSRPKHNQYNNKQINNLI